MTPTAAVPTRSDSVDVLLYDSEYNYLARLAGWTSGAFQEVLSDFGQWTLATYLTAPGVAEALTQHDGRVVFRVAGDEQYRGLLESDDDDPADELGPLRPVNLGGRGILALTDRGQLRGPAGSLTADRTFTNVTPGTIITTALQEAQLRGCFPELSWPSITSSHDSTGAAWDTVLTVTFPSGTSVWVVISTLVAAGYCDIKTIGSQILAANPEAGFGRDNPAVILRPAKEASSDPRTRDRAALTNALLVTGDAGHAIERVDASSRDLYGRREGTVTQAGVTDAGTLARIGDTSLALLSRPSEGYTYAWDMTVPDSPSPFDGTLLIGDYIRHDLIRDSAGVMARLRVRSLAFGFDGAARTCSVELNDLMLEASVALKKQLDALTGSISTIIGNPSVSPSVDSIAPSAPTTIGMSSGAYQLDGITWAGFTATWDAVLTNVDSTACTDLDHYLVSWLIGPGLTAQWSAAATSVETTAYFSQVQPGTQGQARVRAVDQVGNMSPWFVGPVAIASSDALPPARPSIPLLDPMVQGIRAIWDGLDFEGLPMPSDFVRLEVHRSEDPAFVPSDLTLVDTLVSAGVSPSVDLSYGTTYYFTFIAVDGVSNKSDPSAVAGSTPRQADDHDIGDLSVTKLTAGILTADVILSGRIKTANTGMRSEMDAIGFHVYDPGGYETFRAGTTGIFMDGAIHTGGRVEASQFLTESLADILQGEATGAGIDHCQVDSTAGFEVWREETTNLIPNACFGPEWFTLFGSNISFNPESPGGWNEVTFPNGPPTPWTFATIGEAGACTHGRCGPEVLAETGYDFPTYLRIWRTAETGLNAVASARFPVNPNKPFTLSWFTRNSDEGMQLKASVYWFLDKAHADANDPIRISDGDVNTGVSGFRRLSLSGGPPAGAKYATVVFSDADSTRVGGTCDITGVQYEEKDHATEFIDIVWTPFATEGWYQPDPDPVASYAGSFTPGDVPFGGSDAASWDPYFSRTGCIIDLGDYYFGVCTGYEPSASDAGTGSVPGFVQLWQIDTYAVTPRFVAQFRVDVFDAPPRIEGDTTHARRSVFYTHAKLTATSAVCIGYGQSGSSPFGYVIERVDDTITFGPLCALNDDGSSGFIDPDNLDPVDPTKPYGWFGGSMLALSADPNGFTVAATYGGTACYGVASRRFTVAGSTITPDGSWHANPGTQAAFAPEGYSWLYGVAVIGSVGYVMGWDWASAWSLHRIDLSTGRVTLTESITDPRGDNEDGWIGGAMAATADGLTTVLSRTSPLRLEVRTYRPSDLGLIRNYTVMGVSGSSAIGMWPSWLSSEVPVTGAHGFVPWIFMDESSTSERHMPAPCVGLLDSHHEVSLTLPPTDFNLTDETYRYHAWDSGVAVIGDGDYLIGWGAKWKTPGWGVTDPNIRPSHIMYKLIAHDNPQVVPPQTGQTRIAAIAPAAVLPPADDSTLAVYKQVSYRPYGPEFQAGAYGKSSIFRGTVIGGYRSSEIGDRIEIRNTRGLGLHIAGQLRFFAGSEEPGVLMFGKTGHDPYGPSGNVDMYTFQMITPNQPAGEHGVGSYAELDVSPAGCNLLMWGSTDDIPEGLSTQQIRAGIMLLPDGPANGYLELIGSHLSCSTPIESGELHALTGWGNNWAAHDDVLSRIAQVSLYRYDGPDFGPSEMLSPHQTSGAQLWELATHLPEVVVSHNVQISGGQMMQAYGIDVTSFLGVLLKAVQELAAR